MRGGAPRRGWCQFGHGNGSRLELQRAIDWRTGRQRRRAREIHDDAIWVVQRENAVCLDPFHVQHDARRVLWTAAESNLFDRAIGKPDRRVL
jgi:hypothetical protein